jgi:hypothetical protein
VRKRLRTLKGRLPVEPTGAEVDVLPAPSAAPARSREEGDLS